MPTTDGPATATACVIALRREFEMSSALDWAYNELGLARLSTFAVGVPSLFSCTSCFFSRAQPAPTDMVSRMNMAMSVFSMIWFGNTVPSILDDLKCSYCTTLSFALLNADRAINEIPMSKFALVSVV